MTSLTITKTKSPHNTTKRLLKQLNYALMTMILGSLSGCLPTPIPEVPPPSSTAPPAAIQLPKQPITAYLDPQLSTISLYVYRGGRLAHLGHNHVITLENPRGTLNLHPDIQSSALHLTIPVEELQVDTPEARARAGSAFAKAVTAKDIEATRRNMLSDKVLDANNHPFIEISTLGLSGSPPLVEAEVAITIKGITQIVTAEVQLGMDQNQLHASGVLELSQTSFGIEPLRIFGGAITVMDKIDVHYYLVAAP